LFVIGLAAISYDSAAILQDFTQRHGIEYPINVDLKSDIIRSYKVLNTEAIGFTQGMAHPDIPPFSPVDTYVVIESEMMRMLAILS
jgi:hypothetical protein